jgi:cystathionine beta-lyase/cystathionine gamma-synthase
VVNEPFEAFLLIRGMRTLDLRVRAACASALDLAHRLSNHAAIAEAIAAGEFEQARAALVDRHYAGIANRVRAARDNP